jgi:hypothetical protein
VPLIEIFDKIAKKEKHGLSLDPSKVKMDELRDYLQGVQKDYDRERVYASDLKKLFVWYNILSEKGLTKDAKNEEEAKPAKAEKKEKKDSKPKVKKAKKPAAKKS